MVSPKKRAANNKWDRENMTILGCKVRKDYADKVRDKCRERGESVHSVIKAALDQYLNQP